MLPKIDLFSAVSPVIRQAGSIVLARFKKNLTIATKGDTSIVTDADIASEQYLIAELKKILPKASFNAEESGATTSHDYCWVIDPLDGTTNFAHSMPYFCISIALTYKGTPIFGMIYQPLLDELFYAQQGSGAFLNGTKIQASDAPLKKSIILVGLPYQKSAAFIELLVDFEQVAKESYAIRHLGAAALDAAYVACGRADGLFLEELAWWDVAAGIIILQEAGALVTTFDGKPVHTNYRSFVAAGPTTHTKLLQILRSHNTDSIDKK